MPRGARNKLRSVAKGKRRLELQELQDSPDEQGGVLHIGGVRLHCNYGEVQGYTRKGGKLKQRRKDDSEDDGDSAREALGTDEAVQDYLQNLAEGSGDSCAEQEGKESSLAMAVFAKSSLSAGPSVTDVALPGALGLVESHSSEDADSEDSTTSGYNSDISIADIVDDFNDGLSLKQRFPVQFREPWQTDMAAGASTSGRGKSRQRSAARGAKGGRMLPGEKKRLKRAKKEAKRAARAAGKGFDPYLVNNALRDFVASNGDMKAFPAMGKYGLDRTQRLAAYYGLKSSQQGVGKKRFVVVAATQRTCMPSGETLVKISQLLEAHSRAGACLLASDQAHMPAQQRSAGGRAEERGKQRQSFGGPSAYAQPMMFVASGVIDPAASPLQVEPPRQLAALDSHLAAAASNSLVLSPVPSLEYDMPDAGLPQQQELGTVPLQLATEMVIAETEPDASTGFGIGYGIPEVAVMQLVGRGIPQQQSFKRGLSDPGSSSQVTISDLEIESGSQQSCGPPMALQTKKQHRNAGKKREKLQRRLSRGRAGPGPSPLQQQAAEAAAVAVETHLQFGEFERHTTGFGSRMLAKWGFAGQGYGLGRTDQGIAEPLGSTMRPKKLGLGA